MGDFRIRLILAGAKRVGLLGRGRVQTRMFVVVMHCCGSSNGEGDPSGVAVVLVHECYG